VSSSRSLSAPLLIALAVACTACGPAAAPLPTVVEQVDSPLTDLAGLGHVEAVVKLETVPAALLGGVDDVVLDAESGDLLVGDFRSSKQVVRFSAQGRLLATYADAAIQAAPDLDLSGFAVLPGGRVALLGGDRILLFDAAGQQIGRQPLSFVADDAAVLGDRIFVRGHPSSAGGPAESVHAFALQDASPGSASPDARFLAPAARFHAYDQRRNLYPFQPLHGLAAGGGRVFVPHLLDFAVSVYAADGAPLAQYVFAGDEPGEPSELWRTPVGEVNDEVRAALRRTVHRVRSLRHYGAGLLFVEADWRREPASVTFCLFDPEAGVLHRYPDLLPVSRAADPRRLTFDDVVGTYPGGLVGLLDDPDKVALLGRRDERFAGLEHRATDNPLLVLFRIDAPAPPALPPTDPS